MAVGQGALEGLVVGAPLSGRLPLRSTFAGKRVLLTGHTGFKGAWLAVWLRELGAQVAGLGLAPSTFPSLFDLAHVADSTDSHLADLTDPSPVSALVDSFKPDFVLHLAAQALVRPSYADPVRTFDTNVMGTAHLLDALRRAGRPCTVVVVTSDKVYRNAEWSYPYREDDTLGGHDPYSASKAATELVVASFRSSFLKAGDIRLASARAGNVIGGGDWSGERLLPDAVRAWQAGTPLEVRRPRALRPWQHVLDALNGYLVLAESLAADASLAEAWNFGPNTHRVAPVREVVELARVAYGSGEVVYATQEEGPHEAGLLMVESAKARDRLGVSPRWDLETSIARTMDWYRRQASGVSAVELCRADLAAYQGAE